MAGHRVGFVFLGEIAAAKALLRISSLPVSACVGGFHWEGGGFLWHFPSPLLSLNPLASERLLFTRLALGLNLSGDLLPSPAPSPGAVHAHRGGGQPWPVVQVEPWLTVSCGSIHPSRTQLSTGDPRGCSADKVAVGSTIAQLCPPEHRPCAGKGVGGPPTFSPVLMSTLGSASELMLGRKMQD